MKPLATNLAALARHFWRGIHWEKGADGPRPVREPLKFPHLEAHLGDGPAVGLAPIKPGESTTRAAVLDFDSHKGEVSWNTMATLTRNVAITLEREGFAPIPFRSTGGKGIHLYMLWEEPQDAYSVRVALTTALEACGLVPGTKGVKHHQVEIFPKQDSVPLDGVGNMVVLPLAGLSVPLDPPTFELLPREYAETMVFAHSRPVPVLPKVPTIQKTSYDGRASSATYLAEVLSALRAIPNEGSESLDYDSWRNIVFAIHHVSGGSAEGLALAHEFSARSPKYDPTFLEERVWPYVRSDRSGVLVTERSLFDRARKHGWIEDVLDGFENLDDAGDDHAQQVATEQTTAGEAGAAIAPATVSAGTTRPESDAKPAVVIPRFAIIPWHAFLARPAPDWVIHRILPRAELALLIGPSTSGKSFLALDLAGAIARGVAWREFDVEKPGSVIYVAAEGAGGFRNRGVAYTRHYNLSQQTLQIGVISDAPNLMQKDDVTAVLQRLKAHGRPDVIFVDTFAQVTPGANENSGEDMGRALAHCKALHRHTGALIVLVHHVGKDETKGARGWSGIKAAADAEITVSRVENERTATVTKMKDGEDGFVLPFRLKVVSIGEDARGRAIDSCVVEHVTDAPSARRREPKGTVERLVWRAAHDLSDICGGSIPVATVVEEASRQLPVDPEKRDRRSEHCTRALRALSDSGYLRVLDDAVMVAA